ncbi:DUF3899 domain-containing protein [Abyssisolibacter fermentans]|uniref:DUF3899 domain-containing protein n=1 Tax=Abyssisolibacter fermentans TaxID=1766203 RepID=UPI00082E1C8B|nr:DUF3899 domain-containing protein [Abyssisolibacter fermentans]
MKILTAITSIFTVIYLLLSKNSSLLFRFSNAFFILGLIYLCIALIVYVRNVGFFKSISYNRYRRKQKKLIKEGIIDKDSKIMDLGEFSIKKYEEKWESSIFYKFSIPLLFVSLILALIAKK